MSFRSSCEDIEWSKPGYILKVKDGSSFSNLLAVLDAVSSEIIWSSSPWHCKTVGFWMLSHDISFCSGNQVERARIPPNTTDPVKPEYNARAPPWLNPPSTIRFPGVPVFVYDSNDVELVTPSSLLILTSRCIISWISLDACFIPTESFGWSIGRRSNHAGIRIPWFRDTGRIDLRIESVVEHDGRWWFTISAFLTRVVELVWRKGVSVLAEFQPNSLCKSKILISTLCNVVFIDFLLLRDEIFEFLLQLRVSNICLFQFCMNLERKENRHDWPVQKSGKKRLFLWS